MKVWKVCIGCAVALFLAFVIEPGNADANPSIRDIVLLTAALGAWAGTHPNQVPPGGASYAFSAGVFDRVDRVKQTWSFGVERRWGSFLVWRLKPFVGADVTGRRSAYVYGGLRLDLHLFPKFSIVPNFAVANYFHGDGKRLGSAIEFRSGMDLEWRVPGGERLGVTYHHLSHWVFFGSHNPGTEVLALTFSTPLH